MSTQTILWIPIAHRKYAEANGAKYDAEQRVWYVEGEIPSALVEYIALAPRARDYTKEAVPNCPICGHAMVWINTKKPFWGCSQYKNTDCQGSRPGDYAARYPTRFAAPKSISSNAAGSSTFVRGIHLTRILSLLRRCVKNNDKILIWLTENRTEFKGKSALELMGTKEGLRRVEAFILEAFDVS